MDEEELHKYGEIRNIASKNWLSAASVSLAKLDEVKAKVYNIGIADSKSLKPTPRGASTAGNNDKNTTHWASAAPPLSGVSMQKNAWNTVSTVPEQATNIRQECDRQLFRARPESAKTANKRPPSGRLKRRPHSATVQAKVPQGPQHDKDLVLEEEFDDEANSVLGVKGAKFNPSDRPENFSHHSTATGYVAATPGDNNSYTPATQLTDEENDQFMHVKNEPEELIVHMPDIGDMNEPSAPRSSPDLMVYSQTYETNFNERVNGDQIGHEYHQTHKPIHLTIPNPNVSYDEEEEEEEDNDFPPTIHINIEKNRNRQASHATSNYEDIPTQIQFESDHDENRFEQVKNNFTSASEQLNKEVENFKDSVTSSTLNGSNLLNGVNNKTVRKTRPKSASVKFDEKSNMTVDITPRHRNESEQVDEDVNDENKVNKKSGQRQRPHSGRRDLRYVKSRTDSGYSKIANLKRSNSDQRLNVSENANSANKNRPQSAKVSTLTVSYGDDDQNSDNNDADTKSKRKIPPKPKKELETLVSQMAITDNNLTRSTDYNSDAGLEETSGSRPATPAKCFSSSEKNYYELAMKVTPKRNKLKVENIDKSSDEKSGNEVKKTVKTLALLDGREMKEMKFVSVLGAQEHKAKEYVAPRPPSASKTRPVSATKPQSAHNKINPTGDKTVKLSTYRKPNNTFVRKPTPNSETNASVNANHTNSQSMTEKAVSDHLQNYEDIDDVVADSYSNTHTHHNRNEYDTKTSQNEEIKTLLDLENELKQQKDLLKKELETGDTILNNQENLEDDFSTLEERPISRMGFRPDEIIKDKENISGTGTVEIKPPISLKEIIIKENSYNCCYYVNEKRRVTSAPITRNSNIQTAEDSPEFKQAATVTTVKSRPLSAHLETERKSQCSHSHSHTVDNSIMSKKKSKGSNMRREGSITNILAEDTNFKGYANLTTNKLDSKKKGRDDLPSIDVVEIWTRKEDFEFETDGMKECREMQDKLLDNGVPVTLSALQRALLPPTEYGWHGPSYKSNVTPNHPAYKTTTGGLLTRPETWLPKEHKKIKEAKERVQIATEILEQQAREERENAETRKKKRPSSKGKSKKKLK